MGPTNLSSSALVQEDTEPCSTRALPRPSHPPPPPRSLLFFFSGDDAQQHRSRPRPSNAELYFSLPPLMAALWRSAHDKVPCMPTYRTPEAASHNDRQEWQPWAGIREMREQTRAGKGEILLLNMPILVFVSQFHICPIFPHFSSDLGFRVHLSDFRN